ncbi:MAG: ABC transporter ATP-binding protein [Acetobacteraceae bacterium]|nr:ABC transporter ATP-binding protein [Acetobacteraceae bacterium]MCX7685586.1 ABC transporter ATP-binding protein [Acetobacteraceae bacterium]MDW8397345.1 ABC transporter ATP-binding protein [Acetobacteraceae bacterium]
MEQKAADPATASAEGGADRLVFDRVTKRFRKPGPGREVITAVQDVSLSCGEAEVVAVIGPSGCGKSTLLGMASGLTKPSEGSVFVDGEEVDGPNAHVAFMLQRDLLLPWRTIRANVEFGLEIRGVPAAERQRRALSLLASFGLADFADVYPHQISGGMRQRAAMARTLAHDPDVLLLDEPFSALDAMTKLVLQGDLARMLAERRKTALLITHDLEEAVALSDRVLVMSARPGRIIAEIPVDLPDRDHPLARRRHPRMGEFTKELMALLNIDDMH